MGAAATHDTARWKLFAAAVLFSTGGAAIKAAALTGPQIASFRSGAAALALLLFAPGARRGWTGRAWLVGVTYAATLVLYVLANRLTTSANAIFLQSTAPLYLLLLGPWLLREPVRARDVGVIGAVGVGLALVLAGAEAPVATAPDPVRGNALAAASGLTWALTVAGLRWMGANEGGAGARSAAGPAQRAAATGIAAVTVGNLIAFAGMLPWALPVGTHAARDWAVVGYLGVFQIALAYVFVTSALRELRALEAAIILLVEPALNPGWTWIVHGEVPSPWALAGGVVIVGATTVKTWLDARAGREPQPPAPSAVTGQAAP